MAKTCSTTIQLVALTDIATHVSRLCICKGVPISAANAESSSVNCIATTTCSRSGGSIVLADSSLTGKKIDVAAFNNVECISTGAANTLCLISTGATGLIYWQTTFTQQTVASTADTIDIGAWLIRVSDAT